MLAGMLHQGQTVFTDTSSGLSVGEATLKISR